MVYPPGFDDTKIAEEEAARALVIAWLSNQAADVWMWFAGQADWDSCMPIFDWMIRQPYCDRAVAATLFWSSDPEPLASRLAEGQSKPHLWYGDDLARLIIKRFPEAPVHDAGLRPETLGFNQTYRRFLTSQPGRHDPLAVPAWLFGPFGGRDIDQRTPQAVLNDQQLRQALLRLGTAFEAARPVALWSKRPSHIKAMLANETPDARWQRHLFGLALLVPSVLLLGWVVF
jgi:hypothetical protein